MATTHPFAHSDIISGTASGTVLTVIVNLDSQDIIKTVVLAALGAMVSFVVTLLLKWIIQKLKKK